MVPRDCAVLVADGGGAKAVEVVQLTGALAPVDLAGDLALAEVGV